MINKPQHSIKTGTTKFFSAVVLTGAMLLFILKPGISKANDAVKDEIQKILKDHPAKVWKIQESDKNEEETYNLDGITPPDTNTIKSFFLDGGFLNDDEIKDFNNMRKESTKSPSRPAAELTILDVRETATSDFNKAIFITSFIDPFQKTELGKSAFKEINSDATLKVTYSLYCKMHTQNIKTIKIQKENELAKKENADSKEVLKLLQQIEEVYKKYLNKQN